MHYFSASLKLYFGYYHKKKAKHLFTKKLKFNIIILLITSIITNIVTLIKIYQI